MKGYKGPISSTFPTRIYLYNLIFKQICVLINNTICIITLIIVGNILY